MYTSSSSSDDDTTIYAKCQRLQLPAHIAAYKEKRDLNRYFKPVICKREVLEKIYGNYIIMKSIIKHLPWQEKMICEDVCPLWGSVVETLSKEQITPVDFSMSLTISARKNGYKLLKSGEFYTKPLVVFLFGNTAVMGEFASGKCEVLIPQPCSPPCAKEHCIVDVINQITSEPTNCMFVIKAVSIAYLPLVKSVTFENALTSVQKITQPYYTGVYIPHIPGMEFKFINMKSTLELQDFVRNLKQITYNHIIKGALVYLTDHYTLYTNQNNTVIVNCLHILGTLQPDIPFALGGCLVEDTMNVKQDIDNFVSCINRKTEYVSRNHVSLGLFMTPKHQKNNPSFEVYSLVIESLEWSKNAIHSSIREFSQRVPRFEHSLALKLSCSGRQQKHEVEQNCFRTLFPNTRIIGCFGNGELGVNFPPKCNPKDKSKRIKIELKYEKVHSYSTVFVYFGWGKVLAQPANETN